MNKDSKIENMNKYRSIFLIDCDENKSGISLTVYYGYSCSTYDPMGNRVYKSKFYESNELPKALSECVSSSYNLMKDFIKKHNISNEAVYFELTNSKFNKNKHHYGYYSKPGVICETKIGTYEQFRSFKLHFSSSSKNKRNWKLFFPCMGNTLDDPEGECNSNDVSQCLNEIFTENNLSYMYNVLKRSAYYYRPLIKIEID